MARLLARALDLLLPPECPCCADPVSDQGLFCAACFGAITWITPPLCACCGLPLAAAALGGAAGLCAACRRRRPRFAAARAAWLYDAGARRVILPFKHADRPELAGLAAPFLARAGAELLARAELLVPVPLHRRRLFARRYNQAALLARALGRLAGVPVLADALARPRPTPSLDGKSAAERATLLAGAIAVHPRRGARLSGRRVLLVDDVLTSGATAEACADALLAVGAGAVDVLAAARVPDPRTRPWRAAATRGGLAAGTEDNNVTRKGVTA